MELIGTAKMLGQFEENGAFSGLLTASTAFNWAS
jgi:hypothetical protein